LATAGMKSDYSVLHKKLQIALDVYKYRNNKEMTLAACAQYLSNMLYQRRFFPIYSFCLLGGLNETGEGVVYSYDAIGSFKEVRVASVGSGGELSEPLLDSYILQQHRVIKVFLFTHFLRWYLERSFNYNRSTRLRTPAPCGYC
jgi:20S proteasome subunit beta 6